VKHSDRFAKPGELMSYLQVKTAAEPKAAHFKRVENFQAAYSLRSGISLEKGFPAQAAYRMSSDYPDQIALYDFLPNTQNVLVVSEKVRSLLEAEQVKHVEYLPVGVINHKGRKAKEKYFILNLFPLVDCVDQKKTQFTKNDIDEEIWMNVKNLTVLEQRITADFSLFRVNHIPELMLVSEVLAKKMKAAKLRGFEAIELSEYRWP
jgi:hypothetical protein